MLDTLLLAGAEPDQVAAGGVTPLLLLLLGARAEPGTACDEDVLLAALERLLDEPVSLDARDPRGFGPLHLAALHGLLRVAQRLLREGADPDLRDALNRRIPREVALMRGFVDVAAELAPPAAAQPPSMARYCGITRFHKGAVRMGSTDGTNAAHFHADADDVRTNRRSVRCVVRSFPVLDPPSLETKVATLIGKGNWRRMLDSASGTGDIVLRVVREMPDRGGREIIASDISPAMLNIAKRKLDGSAFTEIRELDAHSMPSIPDGSIDLYSISLGLKICDRNAALREALRVLRPGGTFVALEASNIPWDWLQHLYLTYMGLCMPILNSSRQAAMHRLIGTCCRESSNSRPLKS
ncbi:MAG: class I SAM-dependent methyltransferase [Lysobacterales bacterium]